MQCRRDQMVKISGSLEMFICVYQTVIVTLYKTVIEIISVSFI
jgi:hypothetical protein